MYKDEIVEEIHRIREEYLRSFNYDLRTLFADLQKQQTESGREVVNLSSNLGQLTRWIDHTKGSEQDKGSQ